MSITHVIPTTLTSIFPSFTFRSNRLSSIYLSNSYSDKSETVTIMQLMDFLLYCGVAIWGVLVTMIMIFMCVLIYFIYCSCINRDSPTPRLERDSGFNFSGKRKFREELQGEERNSESTKLSGHGYNSTAEKTTH